MVKRLCDLPFNKDAEILRIDKTSKMKRRLFDLGFCPGEKVRCVLSSPLGSLKAYSIKETLIALRDEDSYKIILK